MIIKENRNVFMRQDRSITIESGGLLTIEEDASIGRCHEAEYWREVVVESGGAINSEGSLSGLKEGIKGLANSIVNLETGEIRGLSSSGGPTTGVRVEGAAQLSIQNLTIRLYDLAVEAVNGQNYYNIRGLTTAAVNRGVELKNSPAIIRDCEIGVNGNTAIYVSRSAGTFASNNTCYGDIYIERSPSCVAEGNTIGGEGENGTLWLISSQASALRFNTVYSDDIGIYIRQPDASCIDNDVILTDDGVAGILLGFGDGVQVKNNSVIAPAASRGISDIFSSNNEIHNNSIYGSSSGIRVFGSPNESIVDNIIDASNGKGVDVFNAPNLKFECNSITAAGKGIGIRTNSEGQDFWHNYFAAGTDLEINTVIGPQQHRGNEFTGGVAVANIFGDELTGSQFFVNSNYANHLPANPTPSNGWFVNQTFIQNFYECAGSPGAPGFWNADNWDGMCAHYLYLAETYGEESPQMSLFLLNADRAADWNREDFETGCSGAPWTEGPGACEQAIVDMEKAILAGPADSTSYGALLAAIEAFALIAEPTEEQYQQLAQQALQAQSIYKNNYADYLQLLNDAGQLLATLPCSSNEVVSTSADILTEYIHYIQSEEDTYDYSQMLPYAQLCADSYGRLVHLARLVAEEGQAAEDFDLYDGCLQQERPFAPGLVSDEGPSGEIIYPNPSSGLVTISFKEATTADIQIKDINGKRLKSVAIREQFTIDLNLSDHAGINIIQVRKADGTVTTYHAIVFE